MTDYEKYAEDLLKRIVAYCYAISTQTNADAFFDYSPHIKAITIRIYPDGWSDEADPEYILYEGNFVIDFSFYGIESLEYVVRQLKQLYKHLYREVKQ